MENRKEFAKKFSDVLNKHLIKKYKKVPSANFIANQFNLRADGTSTITSETARKWVKGISVPEIDRFKVLLGWLDFSPKELFETNNLSAEDISEVIYAIESKIDELYSVLRKFKSSREKDF